MPDNPTLTEIPPTELRCNECGKLMISLLDGFDGFVSAPCKRCKAEVRSEGLGDNEAPDQRIVCECGRWLLTGVILSGLARVNCPRCGLMHVGPQGVEVFVPRRRSGRAVLPPAWPWYQPQPSQSIKGQVSRQKNNGDLVALIEDRWKLLRLDRAHRSTDLAVGLRFDVFNRDGFRCRYCGRGPEDGVKLETDHVIPRSEGGPDSLTNLVTACWDCNRGKSAKVLAI